MGSPDAKAFLASPAVVTASALAGRITGPDGYSLPVDWAGVEYSEGEPFAERSVDETLEALINKLDNIIDAGSAGQAEDAVSDKKEQLTEILPGFPEKISGQIIFCSSDNISTDAVYPGKYTVRFIYISIQILATNKIFHSTKTTSPPRKWPGFA